MKYCKTCYSNLVPNEQKEYTPDGVIVSICNALNVPVGRIIGNRRDAKFVEARHMICDILYYGLGLTKTQIGKILGGRNHATVINSISKIQQWCFTKTYRAKYENIHRVVFGHTNFFHYDDDFYKNNRLKVKKLYVWTE